MSSSHPIAILIVNYNSWELLSQCLESLTRQTLQNFHVYVLDNASDQPPPDAVMSIIPNLNFVQSDENTGFAKANNTLMTKLSDTEWVVLLNPDTRPRSDWLEKLIEASDTYPDFDFFSSRLLQESDTDKLDGDGDSYHISGLVWRNGHNRIAATDAETREVFSPCAAAAMYRLQSLLDVGGFDEDFFCYVEDVDLGFRLRLAGAKCLLVPSAVVDHVGSATSGGQKSDFAVYHGHRNLVWCYIKNMPGILFWVFLPLHILLNLVSLVWFSLRGQANVIFRAKLDALKGIPGMWQKRALIQTSRVTGTGKLLKVMDKRLFVWFRNDN